VGFWERPLSRAPREVLTLLYRKFLATATASLLAAGPSRPNVIPLGTVTHAEQAHLGTVEASVGSTIYDGDRLSTGIDGMLRISSRTVTLQLAAESTLTIRQRSRPDGDILAELTSGILVLAAAPNASVAVAADEASIRPAGSTSIVTYVRIVNKRELRISTQRGAVEFSYRSESELIPEGKTLRVLLDPSEKEVAEASESGQSTKKPGKPPKFILIAIGFAAGLTIPMVVRAFESPNRP
jgi:hypothetical protein